MSARNFTCFACRYKKNFPVLHTNALGTGQMLVLKALCKMCDVHFNTTYSKGITLEYSNVHFGCTGVIFVVQLESTGKNHGVEYLDLGQLSLIHFQVCGSLQKTPSLSTALATKMKPCEALVLNPVVLKKRGGKYHLFSHT